MTSNIGSGLGASLGVAAEGTYGTYAAPDHFFEFDSESLKLAKTTIQGGGLAAGRYTQLASRRVWAAKAGGGQFTVDVTNVGLGLLLQHIFGGNAVPVQQAATTAYLQTHDLATNLGKSLTVQKGVPDTTGQVRPYSFLGCKVTQAQFSCTVQDILKLAVTVDSQDVSEADALAAPSYPSTTSPFHGGQMVIKLGAFGAETEVDGITGFSLQFDRPQKVDRYYASSAADPAVKSEPIINGYVGITGSISADFVDKTQLADLVASDGSTSLVAVWTGAVISGTYHDSFTLRVPKIFLDTDTPVVGGPDVVSGDYGFTGQDDGTNPSITAEYQSTDVTL